jgi:sugar lactone lactonase YvrE
VLATVAGEPNGIVGSRTGTIFVSVSDAGQIAEIASGTALTAASGLSFPNGIAIGPDRALYVAETFLNQVSRLPIAKDGTLGTPTIYATGVTLPDGIAFDAHGDLLVAGFNSLQRIDRATHTASTLKTDPLFFWPSSLAFAQGHGLSRHDLFLVNYGLPLGSGTTVAWLRYTRLGARVVR